MVYIPSKALGDVTPEEKWSGEKPSIEHLRIFGIMTYALVTCERRVKLDEKNTKCLLFGVSRESKAYRLYNQETKKIVVSRDVYFDESKGWEWEGKVEEKELIWSETEIEFETKTEPAVAEEENAGNKEQRNDATEEFNTEGEDVNAE